MSSEVCKKGALVLEEEKGEDEELRGRERREVGGVYVEILVCLEEEVLL